MSEYYPQRLANITVTNGTGTLAFTKMFGNVIGITIVAPSGSSVYDVEIDYTDADGTNFPHFGIVGAAGTTYKGCNMQMVGAQTITFSNATVDGTYKVMLWLRPS